jgi:hypothetical protein
MYYESTLVQVVQKVVVHKQFFRQSHCFTYIVILCSILLFCWVKFSFAPSRLVLFFALYKTQHFALGELKRIFYTRRYSCYTYATLYINLLYATLCYSTLLYATLRYSTLTLLYATLRYATLRYSTLLYATLRYSTLLYTTLRGSACVSPSQDLKISTEFDARARSPHYYSGKSLNCMCVLLSSRQV